MSKWLFNTEQEIFSVIVTGLREQKWVQSSPGQPGATGCLYSKYIETPNGETRIGCAVGRLFIAAGVKHELFLGYNDVPAYHSYIQNLLETHEILDFDQHRQLLGMLQRLHDSADTPTIMEQGFRNYATSHGLIWPD